MAHFKTGDHVYVIDPMRIYRVCGVWKDSNYILIYVGPNSTIGQEPFMLPIDGCQFLRLASPAMVALYGTL